MAADKKRSTLPWGLNEQELKPNSVQELSQSKLKAFAIGRTGAGHKPNPFKRKKEEREEKKKVEAEEAAKVFEEFVASFQDGGKTTKTFIKGSTINPDTKEEIKPATGAVYRPSSKLMKTAESKSESKLPPPFLPTTPSPAVKPVLGDKKKTDKKKSILELLGEEFKRMEEERMERQALKDLHAGDLPLKTPEVVPDSKFLKLEDPNKSGSFDTGDPLTTNLYVGNISPKMNEEMLCQHFGKFGPLASVKIMWPRTEEERSRNRNCGFVAFMKRPDAEKALGEMKGSTIMGYEVQIGWGKSVPLPPTPFYMAPSLQEEKKATLPDPPSGLPFNAHPKKKPGSGEPDKEERFEDALYNSVVRVVVPSDTELLKLIHRMIEFVIREGPMFEAIIMNKELNNPKFKFLFDNQSPAHTYYRWKLFSLLQGDSPETWNTNEFRMFENGSLWKPPQLKNLRGKVLPPITEIVKKGQLSSKNRDELEDRLRGITMERAGIKESMVWCLDHAESADEIVECMYEALTLLETPLPLKIARLYLVNDILQNSTAHTHNAAHFRTRFEGRMVGLMEHLHSVLASISSRIRAESFKRRVLRCLQAWDHLSVFHFNFVDRLREVFIGKTVEEMEKKKAFETVAALISINKAEEDGEQQQQQQEEQDTEDLNGLLVDNRPIDFSGGAELDGVPIEEAVDDIDGVPFPDPGLDGVPMSEDIDGVPMEEEKVEPMEEEVVPVKSKWELVDYGNGSSDEEDKQQQQQQQQEVVEEEGMKAKDNEKDKMDVVETKTTSVADSRTLIIGDSDEKRQLLREVELKVMELEEALESSGSYSKQEIMKRANKFREKLLLEAASKQETSTHPADEQGESSTSSLQQQASLTKLDVEESTEGSKSEQKKKRDRDRKDRKGRDKDKSRREKDRDRESRKRSDSSPRSRRHRSSRSHSRSPTGKRRKHSSSPASRSRSRSPTSRRRKYSSSPARSRSRSYSPTSKKRKRSPARRRRSRSRSRERHRSRSPRSSKGRDKHHRSRSRSPRRSSGSSRTKH